MRPHLNSILALNLNSLLILEQALEQTLEQALEQTVISLVLLLAPTGLKYLLNLPLAVFQMDRLLTLLSITRLAAQSICRRASLAAV